jgi:NitT/TauT family transport system substrate-binding protein
MKLTTGFKFFLILLLVGGIVGGLYIFKPELFKKKEGSKEAKSEESSKSSKKSKGVNPDLVLGINTWSGFAPIVWLNGGLEPNTNSKLYQDYGIKLKIAILDDFIASRDGFKSGDYDLVYCTADVLPIEMGIGSGMAESGAKLFLQVDWSRGGDAIVVRKGINNVGDLKGKSIACAQGTASHSLLLRTLESNQLTMKDIISPESTVSVKFFANGIDAATAFKAGEVDAAVVWSPDDRDCTDAVAGSKVLVNTKVATHIIADGILVKDAFLQENKELLVKFATAWLDANGKINKSDDLAKEAAEACHLAWDMPASFFYSGIKNVRLTTLGDNKNFFELNTDYQGITGDQLYTKMSQVYGKLGLSKSALSWNKVSTTEIVEAVYLLENQEAESKVAFSAVTNEVKSKAAISNKQVTINFSTNSSTLSDDAKATIDKEFVNIAKTFANARIRIEGNTDAVGNAAYNKTLSFKRAQAVADYLANEYSFDANRFIVIGNGMTKAVAAGETSANELYRRTDFQLVEE